MPPFPSSDMPGHRALHDRVIGALDTCVESQAVDFKESAPWESMKFKLARTAMAMGNLRDGGVIVIGASERGTSWNLTGIAADDLKTYNVDDIVDGINKYASPAISMNVVTVKYRNDKIFLVIEIREFDQTPFVCKKDGPPRSDLRRGALYIRPAGLAQTTEVRTAEDMQELLTLGAEKRARRMLEMSQRIGLATPSATKPFDDELEGL